MNPVSPDQKGYQRYQKHWETNARFDALWAVLTLKENIGEEWDEDQFFKIGREEIAEVFRFIHENKIDLSEKSKCLDFGSGVGRLTFALSEYFDQVVGLDISPTMVGKADAYAKEKNIENVSFVLSENAKITEQLGSANYDFIYSNITLQHLARDLQKNYLQEFSKLLKVGGLAVVQIPSRKPAPARWNSALKVAFSISWKQIAKVLALFLRKGILPWHVQMELNVFPQNELEAEAKALGFKLESVGYIDWKSFYESTRFTLNSSSIDHLHTYPESPIYFLRKE